MAMETTTRLVKRTAITLPICFVPKNIWGRRSRLCTHPATYCGRVVLSATRGHNHTGKLWPIGSTSASIVRQLIKITLIVALVISALITFAKAAKSDNYVADFLFKDKTGSFCQKPCFLGVQLDQSDDDAFDQMDHNVSMKNAIPIDNGDDSQGYAALFGNVTLFEIIGAKIVSSVEIDFTHADFSQQSDLPDVYPLKLGDIFAILGKPGFVDFFTNSRGDTFCTALYYVYGHNLYLIADMADSHGKSCFSVNTAVLGLALVSLPSPTNAAAWSGFASRNHYGRSEKLVNPSSLIESWRDKP